jgi:hypothetical protein
MYRSMVEERDRHRYDDIKKSMERVQRLMKWAEVSFPRPVTPSELIEKRVESELQIIHQEEIQREEKEKEMKRNLDSLTREINKQIIFEHEEEKKKEKSIQKEINEKLQKERIKDLKDIKEQKILNKEKKLELGNILKRQELEKRKIREEEGRGTRGRQRGCSPSYDDDDGGGGGGDGNGDDNNKRTGTSGGGGGKGGSGGGGIICELMTPVEKELNRVALDAVRTDPVLNSLLQSRLSHRMRMSGGGGMTARGVEGNSR